MEDELLRPCAKSMIYSRRASSKGRRVSSEPRETLVSTLETSRVHLVPLASEFNIETVPIRLAAFLPSFRDKSPTNPFSLPSFRLSSFCLLATRSIDFRERGGQESIKVRIVAILDRDKLNGSARLVKSSVCRKGATGRRSGRGVGNHYR